MDPLQSTTTNHRVSRSQLFDEALNCDVINLKSLKTLAFGGIPETHTRFRALTWKLLLNYLPPEKQTWEKTLKRKRADYERFCEELIIDPTTLGAAPPLIPHHNNSNGSGGSNNTNSTNSGVSSPTARQALERLTVTDGDHPLSTTSSSRWQSYFADNETREQIERDVKRTHPDLNFFGAEKHQLAMQRGLFVFAKLNPGLKYVQGMNELFAPLYHAFATDTEEEDAAHAEADAFFCFIDLMSEFRDHFCQQLDNSTMGIKATMTKLSKSIKAFDPTLYQHMEITNKINPQFYAFRWVTTVFTQEFPFPDMVRIWDSLLSDEEGRMPFLLRFCVAMLLHVREELLKSDFADNMKLLQRYPSVDVQDILNMADSLRRFKSVLILD